MGFKIMFSTGKKIRLPDKEAKELISKFLDLDIMLLDNGFKENKYPIITRYRERGK